MADEMPANGYTVDDWTDGPGGMRFRLRRENGVPEAVEYEHLCNGRQRHDQLPLKPLWGEIGWTVVSEKPLTLTPSLLCKSCGFHGHFRDGKWVPC